MAWPTIFANLAGGNQPLSLFDTMFNQVAQMVAIPSTATGTNALVLNPIGNAPSLTAYQNFSSFRFIAVATSTGLMTAAYQVLNALPVYLSDGVTQAGSGAVVVNQEYVLVFAQALNGGAGGFFLEAAAVPSLSSSPQVFSLVGGSTTYTTPVGAVYLYLEAVGGGGGGAGTGTGSTGGVSGGATSFGAYTANGGGGAGGAGGVGGAGGTASGPAGSVAYTGGAGGGSQVFSGAPGGAGGGSFYGSGGATSLGAGSPGSAAAALGTGGSGAGFAASTGFAGAGGGAGGFLRAIIPSPAVSYAVSCGAQGSGGSSGTGGAAGGNGFPGGVFVIAHFR